MISLLATIGFIFTPLLSSLCHGPLNTLLLATSLASASLYLWIVARTPPTFLLLAALFGFTLGGTAALAPTAVTSFSDSYDQISHASISPRSTGARHPRDPAVASVPLQSKFSDYTSCRERLVRRRATAPMRLAILYLAVALASITAPAAGGVLISRGLIESRAADSDKPGPFPMGNRTDSSSTFSGDGGTSAETGSNLPSGEATGTRTATHVVLK